MAEHNRRKSRCPRNLVWRLIGAKDVAAQQLRLELVRGSRILVVMGSYPGESIRRDYYERARELGVTVVLLENHNNLRCADELIKEGIIERAVAVDLANEKGRDRLLGIVEEYGPF